MVFIKRCGSLMLLLATYCGHYYWQHLYIIPSLLAMASQVGDESKAMLFL